MWLRTAGYGLLFAAAAASLGAAWYFAACIGMAVALVAWVERRVAQSEKTVGSPQAEGRREAEARCISLELACDRSESVLTSIAEGVLVVDGGGEVVLANPAARRALHDPAADPIGRTLWEVLADDVAVCAREAWQLLRGGAQATGEGRGAAVDELQIRYPTIECRGVVYDLTAVPVTSAETAHDYGTVFLLVDATRSHELQQLKDRFLSSVSHELRTPLTNICAYSEILATLIPGESAEWPEFVRVIHEESLQLSHLVDGMFDFLQLECGDAVFRTEEIDGVVVLQGAMRRFLGQARERRIAFEITELPCARRIAVDRLRLEQVCRHLVDNAIKFTPEGGTVRVAFGEVDDAFELHVEDSGPGVHPDDRATVFDKFTQLNDHLTDKLPGAGLGLATSRAIVGRFGGVIWCEDSELGGAAFVVQLPFAGQPQLAGAGAAGGF